MRRLVVLTALLLASTTALAGCGEETQGSNTDPSQVDSVTAPELGACRVLGPADVAQPSNATRTVDCAEPHTAQTFEVGEFPKALDDAEADDPELGEHAYRECTLRFAEFIGGDESLVMRSVVSWAWFRPSEKAWNQGARWYRCDIVGGSDRSAEFVDLPEDAAAMLDGRVKDQWLVCAEGPTVASNRVPCTEPHAWRAVSTIKVGEPEDDYPGDRVVEVRTRDYCDQSVGALLDYPVSYDFAYTWFHEAEWVVGNRRSVCWAKTER